MAILRLVTVFACLCTGTWFLKKRFSFSPLRLDFFGQVISSDLGYSLKNCKGLYIDVGSNIGNQIRKLYEPEKYPGAPAIQLYSQAFRNISPKDICSIGFEANPVHDVWLAKLENNMRCQDWKVKIFSSTAVMHEEGPVKIFRDKDSPDIFHEYAASVVNYQGHTDASVVKGIDLASFMRSVLAEMDIVPGAQKIPIVMKLDAEGVEFQVMPRLINTGVFCSLSHVYMEWHPQMMPNFTTLSPTEAIQTVYNFLQLDSCNVTVFHQDDETYVDAKPSLNVCL